MHLPRLRWILALSALHLVALMVAILLSIGSMPGMDDPDWTPSLAGRCAEVAVVVLGQPGISVWALLGPAVKHADGLEWALFAANSLAWGLALAFVHQRWRARRGVRTR